MLYLVIALIILLLVLAWFFSESESYENPGPSVDVCADVHLKYPWLDDVHGGLDHILWTEPPDSENWKKYTERIWRNHCLLVDHNPENLVEAHMRAFVDPKTRFARLMFYFNDGTAMEPTREFYELEAEYFANH